MNTKICTCCNADLPLIDFSFKNKARNIRHSQCRSCYNERRRRVYRDRDREQILKDNSARKNANNKRYHEWKSSLSCEVCGEDDSCCLDFHHLDPEQKDINVSEMARSYSWDSIMAEVNKCVVVCKNCHCKIHKYGIEQVLNSNN